MFDYTTVPQFTIKPSSLGDYSIKSTNTHYYLLENDQPLMGLCKSNNREIKEQYAMYDLAYGDVLLTGFGFGILPLWVASKPEVTSVTVLETSKEVVELFLQNNQLPDKVTIEYADAKTYVTDKHYDCLLLDHFPDQKKWPVYEEVSTIANNIPHTVLWFWSLEKHYIQQCYQFTFDDLYKFPKSFKDYDFYKHWSVYRKQFKTNTFPELDKERLTYYINCFFIRV